ncbi:MFS family permease [Chitinivorax tropicus]|uniref:MFS family permease n=1 Tax=Chitinivorax tropicus TaxID=714531 RepID=A0A840MKB3_9PROT|nr:YbfB/YjiJ family MFS transporter [Chitinivorax tropicus]MBB5017006.1 MFS family permease [Chitinivorax tropicus]
MKHPPTLVQTLFAGIACVMIVHGIGRFAYTPILPLMVESGLSLKQGGWVASANYVGYLLGALFTICYQGRRRPWLRGALLINILTLLGMPLVQSWPSWAVLRFVAGISNGIAFVYASTFVFAYLAQANRMALSGLLYAGVGLGIAFSGTLVSLLTQMQGHWESGWWAAAGLCALALWPAMQLSEPPLPSAQRPTSARPANSQLTWVALGYGCSGLGYIVSATFLPTLVRQTPGLADWAAASWVLVGLAAIPSTLFWSWLMQRIGELRALLLAYGLQIIGILAPVHIGGLPGVLLGALLLGSTFLGIVVMAVTLARRYDPLGGSRTVGLLTLVYGTGQIIGPLITASLAHHPQGMAHSLEIAAGSLLVGAILLIKSAQPARPLPQQLPQT